MRTVYRLFEDSKPELEPGQYAVPRLEKEKVKKLNPKTNRMKNKKLTKWEIATIKPEDRTLKNIPKYSGGKPKVSKIEWLILKKSPRYHNGLNHVSWGWSPNGYCYGWSHRAVSSFGIGDEVNSDTIGNWKGEKWKIQTNEEAEKMAKRFASEVS